MTTFFFLVKFSQRYILPNFEAREQQKKKKKKKRKGKKIRFPECRRVIHQLFVALIISCFFPVRFDLEFKSFLEMYLRKKC